MTHNFAICHTRTKNRVSGHASACSLLFYFVNSCKTHNVRNETKSVALAVTGWAPLIKVL